jgi:hypothetical protein
MSMTIPTPLNHAPLSQLPNPPRIIEVYPLENPFADNGKSTPGNVNQIALRNLSNQRAPNPEQAAITACLGQQPPKLVYFGPLS